MSTSYHGLSHCLFFTLLQNYLSPSLHFTAGHKHMISSTLAASALDFCLQGDLVPSITSSISALSTAEVDRQVAAINLALEKLSTEASGRIIRLLQKRNTLVPIHRLPVELLVKIFIQALEMEDEDSEWSGHMYFSRLHNLAQVAREWEQIVKSFPEFWTYIDTGIHQSLLGAALTKSRDLPLTVFARDVGFHDSDANWVTVSRQIRRWSAAEVYLDQNDNDSDVLEDVLKYGLGEHGGAQNLTRLKVRSEIPIFVATTFGTDVPRLRQLDLGGIFFTAWNPKLLHQLEWLSLGKIPEAFVAVEDILDMLCGCDRLKFLRIWNINLDDNTLLTSSPSVGLETVTDFVLEGLSCKATLDILNAVRLPHCTQYTICPVGTSDGTAIVEALSTCATRKLASALEKADYVSLEVTDDKPWYQPTSQKQGVQLQVRPLDNSQPFSMQLGGFVIVRFMDWLVGEESFRQALGTTSIDLSFAGELPEIGEADILRILERLPSVTFLKLFNLSHKVDDLLLRFCNPQLAEPGPFQWLLPNLLDLNLHRVRLDTGLLLEMARQRTKDSACIEYGLPPPASLRQLSLWPAIIETYQTFQRITGAEVLRFWDASGALIETQDMEEES
ncbi:hypothetical protein FRB94_002003 [Tulasnella sp. JGI-2019a]|nr:hypothetical protein FRB94_002003 [Tulasnella sp. JGI-2019a]